MTIKEEMIEENTAVNGADVGTHLSTTDSEINAYKSMNEITPIFIAPLPIDIIQQLQRNNSISNNIITSLPTATTSNVSPALQQEVKSTILTPEEKRQRRLWRNRVAAKECRKKKKLYIHDMEGTIERLTKENDDLRKQVDELKAKMSNLPILDENYRLIKEVEKLNAQLKG